MMTTKSRDSTFEKSILNKIGEMEGGADIIPDGIKEYIPASGLTT